MKRFDIFNDDAKVGEIVIDEDVADDPDSLHAWLRHSAYAEIRDPESEPTGKLPSEWIREYGTAAYGRYFDDAGAAAMCATRSIIAYLDERLGRAPGEGTK